MFYSLLSAARYCASYSLICSLLILASLTYSDVNNKITESTRDRINGVDFIKLLDRNDDGQDESSVGRYYVALLSDFLNKQMTNDSEWSFKIVRFPREDWSQNYEKLGPNMNFRELLDKVEDADYTSAFMYLNNKHYVAPGTVNVEDRNDQLAFVKTLDNMIIERDPIDESIKELIEKRFTAEEIMSRARHLIAPQNLEKEEELDKLLVAMAAGGVRPERIMMTISRI